ncbi:DUF5681 domain-containing protein [Sinorhizobium sp. BG8]|uniref:DUF5681 domain-containing protein n=1 Tax=Sinorhizobium sp. BG8 TaxID=2613773 RepID=UPI00193EA0A3|nr:DUF5681 domain-containing protein [Sinorhizobium sp. BG8]QRM54736.1 hypothetical protein F3Y30_09410 [Sinorhizobium sp. BG8]
MAKRPMTAKQLANLQKNQFPKGKSGNPKGRTPTPEELKISAAEMSPDALKEVQRLAKTSKNDMVRLKANELILSYNLSKAAQKVDVSGEIHHNHTSDLIAKAAKAREIIEGQVIEAKPLPDPDNHHLQ